MHIQEKLKLLPDAPGCYLMKNDQGTIIYVGKAKSLKKRVRSYFLKTHHIKTEKLVEEIYDFEYMITSSEQEAFLLELNLIKEYQPKYNILLKDDKQYPYLKITKEKYPRLLVTRKIENREDGYYFGPYPNVAAARQIKQVLDELYPLRKCHVLPKKPCLYYHIDQCLAPCIQEIDVEVYEHMVRDIKLILKGHDHIVIDQLTEKMKQASQCQEYEKAAYYRDQIQAFQTLDEQQKVIDLDLKNRDVVGIYSQHGMLSIQIFMIRQGKLIDRDTYITPYIDSLKDALQQYLSQFYQQKNYLLPEEIILSEQFQSLWLPDFLNEKLKFPKQGKKYELLSLAEENAKVLLEEELLLEQRVFQRTEGAVAELAKKLNIKKIKRIEAFDNAHFSGSAPVSGVVVFIDGKPAKQHYRKYHLKTVSSGDDYQAMREVVYRRYSHQLKNNEPLPDLIIVDGGVGQLRVVQEVLEEQLGLKIPVLGSVKNDRHRTDHFVFGNPVVPLYLDKKSALFLFLEKIQNEVHRFVVNFHRQTSQKTQFTSILDQIPGIGPKRKQLLLKHFKTLDRIKSASQQEFEQLGLPKQVAQDLYKQFH